MQKFSSVLLILTFLLMGCFVAVSGSDYRFVHITSKEGLPHQQVEAMAFDNKGYLWIGTRNGLSRYDGYSIKTYYNDPSDSTSLCHNFVRALYFDSKNRLWIGTPKGICRFQEDSEDFKVYRTTDVATIIENVNGRVFCSGAELYVYDEKRDDFELIKRSNPEYVVSMAADVKGRLFVATNSSISYYDSSLSKTTQIDSKYFADFLTGVDGIVPLKFDEKGRLWVGRNGKGISCVDLTTGEQRIYEAEVISDGTVRVIAEDHEHNIWLGTEKGITVIEPDGNIDIIRQNFVDKNKLNDNAIYSIIADKNDNIWIGTYFGGINILLKNNDLFKWIEPGYSNQNVRGKAVREMIELQNGFLWIATEDGGINIYDKNKNQIEPFDRIPDLGHNVHCLYFDKTTDELWIGTFRNGLFCYNLKTGRYERYLPGERTGLESDAIFSITKQGEKLWVGTTHGLRYFDILQKKFCKVNHPILDTFFIYCLLVDSDGNLWVGTNNQGLYCIDSSTNEIKGWTADSQTNLGDDYITCLYQDSNNKIWLGTNNDGLHYIDPLDLKIKSLDNELSLFRNSICSIIEDKIGNLWVSTSRGLYKYNIREKKLIRYTTEDGLPTNQFNFDSSILAQDGKLYWGSVNGLIAFDPEVLKSNKGPFPVHLGHLTIDNEVITVNSENSPLTAALDDMDTIVLSYDQSRSFSIDYLAVSLDNARSLEYQVCLEGVDKGWRNAGQERKFVGLKLSPGTYRLKIRANNSNVGWENAPVKVLTIVIRPPFYLSIWAYIIYVLILIALLFIAYRIFSIRLNEKNAIRMAKIEKDKLEEMNKEKIEFFTTVSHELKTPLSLIVAPLKYISQQKELGEESEKRLEIAIKNTNKMVGIIDELVTFNKVESGNSQFFLQEGNPLDFIENTAMLFKENAEQKNISLFIHCENNGEDVWFSPLYVERITNNLLSNALKFTPANGKVVVKAEILNKPDGYIYLRIEVSDTGIGIVKEEIQNIFSKYYQTKRGHNVNNKGWGIGLALVKRLTEIHKGSISVDSTIGKGSSFVVYLNVSAEAFDPKVCISGDKTIVPLSKYVYDEPSDSGNSEKTDSDVVVKDDKLSILIVEDNKELLQFLVDYFSSGYNVYTAENGAEALEVAHKSPIQLVVSDVMMPVMDGFVLCQTLKNDIQTSHIPVILLTAKNDTGDVVKGYESGAEAYVPKPFDPQILELQMKNIMRTRRMQQEQIINAENPDMEETSLSKFDKEFISQINELIDENLDNNDFSITFITQQLGISRSLLHVKMKNLLNISTGDYIRKKRLNKACSFLEEGYNVSETAYRTGFSDPNYFSKTFKKEFGMTPTEYLDSKKVQANKSK